MLGPRLRDSILCAVGASDVTHDHSAVLNIAYFVSSFTCIIFVASTIGNHIERRENSSAIPTLVS